MMQASPVEVTVKCRIGVDDQMPQDVLPDFIALMRDTGIRRIAVAVNHDNQAFSASWLAEFRRAYEAVGGTVLIAPFFAAEQAAI